MSAGPRVPARARAQAYAGAVGMVVWAALAGACGISLQEQKLADDGAVDAAPPEADAPPAAVCANGRVVYLHFDGLTLTRVSARQTDATRDRADWLGKDQATVPAYKISAEATARATEIQEITAAIRRTLGAFPVTVVTERPPIGPYHMVVFGGTSQALGNNSGAGALTNYDCGNRVVNNVVWIGERFSVQDAADYAVGGIGLGLGLVGTKETSDCLCGWGNDCVPQPGACTLSSQILNDGACNGGKDETQNEIEVFRQEFCQPLAPTP